MFRVWAGREVGEISQFFRRSFSDVDLLGDTRTVRGVGDVGAVSKRRDVLSQSDSPWCHPV